MIKELTPTLLSSLLLFVVSVAASLTLLISALLLWRYRRAVTRNMAASGGSDGLPPHALASSERRQALTPGNRKTGTTLYQYAMHAPWRLALSYASAGLAFALVFAIAAHLVYSFRLGLPGFLVGVWVYTWPVVVALLLVAPASWRLHLTLVVAYFGIFLFLILWAGTITDLAPTQFGALTLPARSSATPETTMRIWLVANAVPTLLVLLCFNRWVRAVAPLVLAFVTTAISGMLVAYFALFSERGVAAAVAMSTALKVHVAWLVLGTALLSLAAFGAFGWALARWIARAYRRGTVSDQSLMLDALWLLFATLYAMWLILGGLAWTATAVAAFAVYKLALVVTRALFIPRSRTSHGLTFLRVFSLGRRSERLLDALARYWRHIGSVQIITGPDVARSTVQPHQFLDFLSGRLATHFVRDADSLARSFASWNRARDRDGRYRINNFFCHADSWKSALPQLAEEQDVVLMDLRSFSATNAGCIHELKHLVDNVPLERCLLLVDDTTDIEFLERTLQQAWQNLQTSSPNRGHSPKEVPIHRFGAEGSALPHLVRRLCDTEAK